MKKIVSLWLFFLSFTLCIGQNEKTVDMRSPGTLSMLLSHNDMEETTLLKITGRMNAKDFGTIDSYMNSLKVLDLKDVKIETYTGVIKPQEPSAVYPENQIPSKSLQNKKLMTQIILPDNLTVIREGAFSGCSNLTSIVLPHSLKVIAKKSFYECTSLTSIEIPSSVISIEDMAFSKCTRLSEIKLNEGLRSIGKSTFSSCSSLEEINLPHSLTSIGETAFENCKILKHIYTQNPEPINLPKEPTTRYLEAYKQITLYVPANAVQKYSAAYKSYKFKHIKPID